MTEMFVLRVLDVPKVETELERMPLLEWWLTKNHFIIEKFEKSVIEYDKDTFLSSYNVSQGFTVAKYGKGINI